MPRSVADAAKQDMWLSVILGGVLMLFSFWVTTRLSQYFPDKTCLEYHRILLGPLLGQVLNIILLSLIAAVAFIALRTFSMALKMFVLETTPPQIIVFVLLLLAVYAVQYGLDSFVRLQQFIIVPNYFFFLTLIVLGVMALDTKNYQPTLADGFSPVLKGTIPSWFAYTGPELITGLLYPFITRKEEVLKWGSACVGTLTVLYTMITLFVQGILGSAETAHMIVPTIIAYREVEIPDTFIERLDGYLMIFWIPIYFTSLSNCLYFASFGAGRLLKLEYSRPLALLFVPVIYYLTVVPPDLNTMTGISKLYNIIGMVWGLGILPLLLLIAWLREKRRSEC